MRPILLLILLLGVAISSHAQVVINEIHYSPSPNNEAVEYVELYNNGPDTADLSSWKFTDGFSYTFPESSALASGAYLILAQNETEYNRKFGSIFVGGLKASGQFLSGLLSDSGEEITLRDAIKRGSLIELPVPHRDWHRRFYLILHKQKYRSAGIERWLELCDNYDV